MFRKILVAYDGSPGARLALKVAISLARMYEADLFSLSVMENMPRYAATIGETEEFRKEAEEYFRKINEEAVALAENEGVRLKTRVKAGHEVETIVNYIKDREFDLLVIGFMGHSHIFGRIWGSTSQNLTKLSPCTVIVVK